MGKVYREMCLSYMTTGTFFYFCLMLHEVTECSCCGKDLSSCSVKTIRRCQVYDIPPMKLEVTEQSGSRSIYYLKIIPFVSLLSTYFAFRFFTTTFRQRLLRFIEWLSHKKCIFLRNSTSFSGLS